MRVSQVRGSGASPAIWRVAGCAMTGASCPWLTYPWLMSRPCRARIGSSRIDALRDWVWSAVDGLSQPLREVVLLRYFTEVRSYAAIAALCGVPVGTVRSRLNQARQRLMSLLEATARAAHPDATLRTARRAANAAELMAAGPAGSFAVRLADAAVPDLLLVGPAGQRSLGQEGLVGIMEWDVAAGVVQRVRHVVASTDTTVLECDLMNPASGPEHCPPGVVWLMSVRDERIETIRLFHPSPLVDA